LCTIYKTENGISPSRDRRFAGRFDSDPTTVSESVDSGRREFVGRCTEQISAN
jgi:hypothetical protein